jgi:hypothetical protein
MLPIVPVGVLNAPIWHTLAGESLSVQSVTGFTAILERSILAVGLGHWMPADGRMHGLRGVTSWFGTMPSRTTARSNLWHPVDGIRGARPPRWSRCRVVGQARQGLQNGWG